MSTQQHTPGPWIGDGFEILAEADCEIHPVAVCLKNHSCRSDDEVSANAHLIAAAPDLLEALQAMVDSKINVFCEKVSDRIALEVMLINAHTAIAKARGES